MGFQQGLSGLNASSKNLDVIGHNIANSNTVGFKASRTEFASMVATAIGTASTGNAGIGVQVGAVAQQFTQGNITVTGNNLDVAINGNGFFKIQQPDGSFAYTRAGNFKLDDKGNVITNNGGKVMGYPMDPITQTRTASTPQPLVFPTGAPIPAKQTTSIKATFNLDARAPDAAGNPSATPPIAATPRSTYGTSLNVYDSQGVATPVSLYFQKTGTANTWDVYDRLDDPNATPPVVATPIGQITFDNNGQITGPAATPPATGFQLPITIAPPTPNPNNLPAYTVQVNLDGVTQFGAKFAVSDLTQDGYTAGQLTGINIGDDGTIMTSYSNGVTRAEGQIALASFRNAQGLADIGNNLWVETFESGQPVMGVATEGAFGALRSGALEDSNVDLTAELVNMMTAQRAYQANAQTIKTQDQVMSTLVNLR
ncbi:flagellar hook protein FlgE [Alicycliphilus denitrificans]|uniref:Flagellar hook protein FlgE n=2 Tax=Alicycliphilus denitrificans TaxID=179636 RepID=F4G6T0_ALIDK|nr:flagellar hook protein FlgE [Alicycliphilus denitrificans]GAO21364.1 flagellar hook-basal body protein [Alicycliphilus sp. B1]ADV01589.1 flagellar hook-basal body protein [Alicycliphilus denitrificans BC]AEB86542.1 flagellar hook-basal body protein [Alicycliphilus denitrificans K601]QKD45644.1 flagellar hook protein FlgE [Alicycliphilus denitrificans]GAO25155.1 flagellar hook-basal body protein [Alicycliphilus sp. B1]